MSLGLSLMFRFPGQVMDRALRPVVVSTSLAVCLLLGACDPDFPSSEGEAPVDRETFVETYVELRLEALKWDGGRLPEEERNRILDEMGVTADELRAFVRVHGRNVPFMALVWTEVDERMSRRAGTQEIPGVDAGGDPEGAAPPPAEPPGR